MRREYIVERNNYQLNYKKVGITGIIFVLIIFLAIILVKKAIFIEKKEGELSLVINNRKVNTKQEIYINEDGIIYLSEDDIRNFFDKYLLLDYENNQLITTYDKHIGVIDFTQNTMLVNGSNSKIKGNVIKKDDIIYIPFSEMKLVFDVEISYLEDEQNIVVTTCSREIKQALAKKNLWVKENPKRFSQIVDTIKKGETVIVAGTENGYTKIRTASGEIGYVSAKKLVNEVVVRESMEETNKGQVSLLWDYYSDYGKAPDRTGTTYPGINVVSPAFFSLVKLGKGDLVDKVGSDGMKYMNWAEENGYKVWAMVQNDGMIETTSEILNSYKLRTDCINNIVRAAVLYRLDGINIDFEYMYEADKNAFSRFIIELYPRLKEYGITLSVDVTAPDGAENYSLCYDRNTIASNCDYIIFMAYDQYNTSKEGTTSGYNWVKTSLDKFIKREEVPAEKLILALPFYARLWKTEDGKTTNSVVSLKNMEKSIPEGLENLWKEDLKQYYIEYSEDGTLYKLWIEDDESLGYKLDLFNEYQLAGVAFWAADRENDTIFNVIQSKLKK